MYIYLTFTLISNICKNKSDPSSQTKSSDSQTEHVLKPPVKT